MIHPTDKQLAIAKADDILRENGLATYSDVSDTLLRAMPFVEDMQADPCYRPGTVSTVLRQIRDTLRKAGAL